MSLKILAMFLIFRLNNEINCPVNGQILHKDKEALRAFSLKTLSQIQWHSTASDKINYLIENDYIESEFILQYEPAFIENCLQKFILKIPFQSFMAAL